MPRCLGDGLRVYFGYPLAHEDDAQRAVRAGLGIVETLKQHNIGLQPEGGVPLAVRLGIHSGVVVGEVGRATRQAHLALCEIPNIAARLPGIAGSASVKLHQRGRPNFQHPRRRELASGVKPSTI